MFKLYDFTIFPQISRPPPYNLIIPSYNLDSGAEPSNARKPHIDVKSPLSIPFRGLYYVGAESYTECFSRIIPCRRAHRLRPEGSFRHRSNHRLIRQYHRLTMSRRQA